MQGETIDLERFSFALSERDLIAGKGKFDRAGGNTYGGELNVAIRDLAVLRPVLAAFEIKESVSGAVDLAWQGDGALPIQRHRGETQLSLRSVKYGSTVIDDVNLSGRYAETQADGALDASAGPTRFRTKLDWENDEITLRNIELRQGDLPALRGDVRYGTRRPTEGAFDPLRQPIAADLQVNQLDLQKLLASLGKNAPVSGRLSAQFSATGTPLRPELRLKAEARDLKAKAAEHFGAANVDLDLNYAPGKAALRASVRQPLLQPVDLQARMPLDLEKVIAEKKLNPALPLEASLKLPPTSLAVLPKLAPQIRRIAGTVAADVRVAGTIEKPQMSGAVTLALQDARLANDRIPAIGKFDARLAFSQDRLSFERFHGEVGGGLFELRGAIHFPRLDAPVFDLRLQGDDVLVLRDDSISVRADSDVQVTGPLKAGKVVGNLFITQSRFFKEIDILPIGLPGRAKPAPRSAPSETRVSLPPPLDQWAFDLGIKTRADDPFLVRGNLANGSVSLNLKLAGTGRDPWLEGAVTINQFTGSLPFSTITVNDGNIYFTKDAPFQPALDLYAQSRIRDYAVGAYIFGKPSQPQLQLTSEPPLPHADIVSLLATGTTTSELGGSADVLASRAAMLAVQSLWKKMFKRGSPAPAPAPKPQQKKGDAGLMDRFELELGSVDQKTGSREATAKFKVNDQTYILGEVDTQGRYTGSLKYLLRFR
jgi:hypothetical protein